MALKTGQGLMASASTPGPSAGPAYSFRQWAARSNGRPWRNSVDTIGQFNAAHGAEGFGFRKLKAVHWNLEAPQLYEESLSRSESRLARGGALCADTGTHTGRSPKDKFTVRDALTENTVWWDNNNALSPEHFETLLADFLAHAEGKELFAQDLYGGADPVHRVKARVYTEMAWHSLFIRNLLIRPARDEIAAYVPEMTIVDLPSFRADPKRHGCRSETVIAIDFTRKIVLIGGSAYAGEMKKSVFTYLNYVLPTKGVVPMHCSANVGSKDDSAIFFGLSGTGKTTLSADPERTLIGDDEHGWSDRGVFNFEGGCYAKVIKLSASAEPEIYETTRRFGTVLENVAMDSRTGRLDLDDASLTENTRAAYPITHIPNATRSGMGGHPRTIVMLTAAAFGVMPPIAKLSPDQAMYYFLSGYTAKVAGTEQGVTEPTATFSTCFGAPFMALSPTVYANLLGERIARHGAQVWLVNTGWTGGAYGVGHRMPIQETRAMIAAALSGELESAPTRTDPTFKFSVPTECPGVSADMLDPRNTWANPGAYDEQAAKLAGMFAENFDSFVDKVPAAVRAAGP